MSNESQDNIIRGRFAPTGPRNVSENNFDINPPKKNSAVTKYRVAHEREIFSTAREMSKRDNDVIKEASGDIITLLDMKNQTAEAIDGQSSSMNEKYWFVLMQLGIDMAIHNRTQRMISVHRKHSAKERVDNLENLIGDAYSKSYLMNIAGTSLKDIATGITEKQIGKVNFFFKLADIALANSENKVSELLPEEEKDLDEKLLNESVATSVAQKVVIMEFYNQQMKDFSPDEGSSANVKYASEVMRNVKNASQIMYGASREVHRIFSNPKDPQFDDVVLNFSEILNKYPEMGIGVFYFLNWKDNQEFVEFYRRVSSSLEDPEYGSFYKEIEVKLQEFIAEYEGEIFLSVEDADMFVEGEIHHEEIKEPDLKKEISSLNENPKLAYEFYEIDPKDLYLGKLISPSKLKIVFDEKRLSKFNIHFGYENEEGESSTIIMYFDTKEKKYDWSIRESNVELPGLWNMYYEASKNVLGYIVDQIEQEKLNRKASMQTSVNLTSSPKRVYQGRDETYDLRKSRDGDNNSEESITSLMKESFFNEEKENSVKNKILFPEDEKVLRGLFKLSDEDFEFIIEELKEKNEDGTLYLSKLRKKGKDGTDRFVYRTKAVDRTIRVLFRMQDSDEERVRAFAIVRGGYRKNAYRDEGLGK